MKQKFIKKVLVLCLFIFAILFAMAHIVDTGLRKSGMEIYTQWTDIFGGQVGADVVFSGPSRTQQHISPAIFDSILHVKSYNMGINGWTFNMQYVRFKIYLEHNKKPKYIVQNVDFDNSAKRKDLYGYEQFFPYINDPEVLKASDQCVGKFTLAERYFPMFKYNNHFYIIKEGFNCYFNTGYQVKSEIQKGFFYRDIPWDGTFDEFKKAHPNGISSEISQPALDEFEGFLKYCKRNDIKVILDFAPIFYEEMQMEHNLDTLRGIFRKYAKQYDIPLLDYTTDSMCYIKKYFYNSQHLNKDGAILFTTKLANDLKGIVKP